MYRKLIKDYDGLVEAFREIRKLLGDELQELKFSPYKPSRSLQQNQLMWKWNGEIAAYVNETGLAGDVTITAEDIHERITLDFWGIESKEVLGRIIEIRKQTRNFTVAEMCKHLEFMQHWTGERQIPLTIPPDYRYVMFGEH